MNSRRNVNGKDGNECPVLGCSYGTTDEYEILQHVHDIVAYQVDPDYPIKMITHVVNHKNWNPFQCELCNHPSRYFLNKDYLGSHKTIQGAMVCRREHLFLMYIMPTVKDPRKRTWQLSMIFIWNTTKRPIFWRFRRSVAQQLQEVRQMYLCSIHVFFISYWIWNQLLRQQVMRWRQILVFRSRRRWPRINLSGGYLTTCCNYSKDSSTNTSIKLSYSSRVLI